MNLSSDDLIWLVLAASLAANAFLLFKKPQRSRTQAQSYEATALLHDLTSPGVAMVEVRRIDPSHVMLRSPRT